MPSASSTTADAAHAEGSPEELDFWIAIAAGEPVWADPDDDVAPIAQLAAIIEIFALAASITITWTAAVVREDTTSRFAGLAPWIATASLLAIMVRPLRLVLAFRHQANLWTSFLARIILITITVACMMLSSSMAGLLSLWPLAVALGVEAALCAWTLGFDVEPIRWWMGFLRSPLHMGIVGAVAGSVVYLGVRGAVVTVIPIYLVVHLCVLGSAVVARVLDRFRQAIDGRLETEVAAAAAAEHRQSAHWLHDDVSAELKLVELKLRNGDLRTKRGRRRVVRSRPSVASAATRRAVSLGVGPPRRDVATVRA